MRRLLLGLLLALALALAPSASAAEPGLVLGGNFFGDGQIPEAGATGAGWARVFLYWWDLEPTQNGPNEAVFQEYSRALTQMHNNGLKTVVVVTGAPGWATGSSSNRAPPRDPDTYARFVGALAQRLTQVDAWEIWNEPDAGAYWDDPDPVRYTALLKPAYVAIKAANPKATVLFGGLTGNDYPFLQGAYAAGARGYFDGVAVHTDTSCNLDAPDTYARDGAGRISQFSFLGYRSVHQAMVEAGDGDTPIWLTEMGWSAFDGPCPGRGKGGGVTPEAQAADLRMAFHCLAQDPYVKVALWFSLRDYSVEGVPDNRYGLDDFRGDARPARAALEQVARRGDTLTGPCGDFDGPSLTVAQPTGGARLLGPQGIAATASDPAGVVAVQMLVDGATTPALQAIDLTAPPTLALDPATQVLPQLPDGPHTLTFVAFDRLGNARTSSVQVVSGAAASAPLAAHVALRIGAATRTGERRVRATVTAVLPADPAPAGTVRVVYERLTAAGWRAGHRLSAPAQPAPLLGAHLLPGTWRVRASFVSTNGYAPAAATSRSFAVAALQGAHPRRR